MARLVKKEGRYGIYELDQKECAMYGKEYPTVIAWDWKYPEDVGNVKMSETEGRTLEEVLNWLREYR